MRILIVDDEPAMARSTMRILRAEDHEVATAGGAGEALAILAEDQMFDIVISDFNMPGMKGDELLTKIHGAHPRIALILFSGGTGMVELSMESVLSRCPRGTVYLRKPFTLEELFASVQKACRGLSA